jgi:hypothetical protein
MTCSVFEPPSNQANRGKLSKSQVAPGSCAFFQGLPEISRSLGQDPLPQLVVRFLIAQEMPGLFWTGKSKKVRLTSVDHADLTR